MIAETYEDWHRCITVDCGIKLDSSFVRERISALENQDDAGTISFIHFYGLTHYSNVLKWFHMAQRSL